MSANTPTAVVTGISTGIGLGIATVLIERGWTVFGSVRKQADADRVRAELGERLQPLVFDVTDGEGLRRAALEVAETLEGRRLQGLVNNAGIAVSGPLLHLEASAFRRQLEVNLIAPMVVTQAFAPLLGTDRARAGEPGRVVMISSVGGRLGAPFIGAYVASKHGLEGLSETLRRELLLYGIDVILVGPGSVATPIWDKAEQTDWSPYAQTEYAPMIERFSAYFIGEGRKGLAPRTIGEVVHRALTTARPKVRYGYDVVPQPLSNWVLPNLLPKRMLDRVIGRSVGLLK